jgi:ferredoxin
MAACVVTAPCRDCKYTDCVTVCPVDCFYEDEHMLVIDPTECIDCGACIPECPVEAIYHEEEVPAAWQEYVELNATLSAVLKERGAPITQKKEPKEGPGCKRRA